jgi:energy-coupling factor transport system ATP-binding protein
MSFIAEVEDVWFSYSDKNHVLKEISFRVRKGEFLAIIGRNGSGKSTLMRLLVGLIKPTRGKILIDSLDTSKEKVSTLARKVGFVFQNPNDQLFCRSVEEEVTFALRNIGLPGDEVKKRTDEALEKFSLKSVRGVYPRFLSRGDKQRVSVAAVSAMNPELLILDEPTTGQDYRDSTEIMKHARNLNAAGMTVILVTHDIRNVATYTERAILLDNGKIVADASTRHVLTEHRMLRECNLSPPQITELAKGCKEMGVRADILSVDEMAEEVVRVFGGSMYAASDREE